MNEHPPTEFRDDDDATSAEFDDRGSVQYFCRLTFGQFFTLVVLLVITVCSTFYLGARYGNNYLRLDGLPMHDTAQLPIAPASPAAAAPINASQQEAIEDSELKRLARQALQREQQQKLENQVEAYLNAPVPTQPPPGQQQPSLPPAPAALPPQPQPIMQAEPIAQPQPAAPSLSGATGTPYAVQLGAYRNYEEANTHLEDWKAKGYPAYLMSADIPDSGRWYRVRVGAFATRDDAQSFREELGSREAVDGIVVRNE